MSAAEASSRNRELLDAAIGYAKAGWPVLPVHTPRADGLCDCGKADCTSNGKHPWTEHGLTDATTTELQIRRWWKQWPLANIGIGVPPGHIIVDVDGPEGDQALGERGYSLPPTATAKTGRGYHYVYASSVKIPPKVGILPKVDLRGPGSYVVAAPSLHESGNFYTWVSDFKTQARVPMWLIDKLQTPEQAVREKFDTASALEGVSQGARDETLFKLASKLRYADVPFDIAANLVLEAAAKCSPPLPQREALAKVQSAYGRYTPTVVESKDGYKTETLAPDRVRVTAVSSAGPVEFTFEEMEKSTGALSTEFTMRLLLPDADSEPYHQRINLLSASARNDLRRDLDAIYGKIYPWVVILQRSFARAQDAYLNVDRAIQVRDMANPGRLQYLVDRTIPDEGLTILFGTGSGGKTFLAMFLAICIANGIDFLGRPTKKRKVGWIDYGETKTGRFRHRIERAALGLDLSVEEGSADNILYLPAGGIPFPDLVPSLRRSIERHGLEYLMLDHIAIACGGEPEKAVVANDFARALDRVGLPMLALAHVTADGQKNPEEVLKPFGSIFWHNTARQTWFLQREQYAGSSKAMLGMYSRKTNDGAPARDFALNMFFDDSNDGNGAIQIAPDDIANAPLLDATRAVHMRLRDLLWNEQLTTGEAAARLGVSEDSVKKAFQRHASQFVRVHTAVPNRGQAGVVIVWGTAGGPAVAGSNTPEILLGTRGQPLREIVVPNSEGAPATRAPFAGIGEFGTGNGDSPQFDDEEDTTEVPF